MSGFAGKKRKQDAVIPNRVKPNKGLPKITVEDIYPFTVSNLEYISPELKQYVN